MKMSKFFGNPQRFIILEGLPESNIVQVGEELRGMVENSTLIKLPPNIKDRDWTVEEFIEDAKDIVYENVQDVVIFTHFILPEYLYRNEEANKIKLFECFLNDFPSFAFFLRGSRGYYQRKVKNLGEASQLYLKQEIFEEAYKKSQLTRKLLLSGDGHTSEWLAKTVMFQSEICQIKMEIEEG
jgi:hypothetical protein